MEAKAGWKPPEPLVSAVRTASNAAMRLVVEDYKEGQKHKGAEGQQDDKLRRREKAAVGYQSRRVQASKATRRGRGRTEAQATRRRA